ncbi:glycosyltransferase family 2 protein [Lysinibacillus sp. 1 U-2021]|uniref:glycosyltransferase family 2 protein n=1 Tax=Lysinibacillus sp. 1 U-2021 TaxID=3039426 RepID=UPI00248007A3|nr:glycosyltransferase family 2 protein [Lysinibacillus sp. 1 U-2021]WGT40580.1 glycosyltransferase family 2 protein [Lysinibacillus sp. 1 U-2021]
MNEESIKLSICIPTYNRAQILKNTLLNVLDCIDDDIEIVVSDNNSEDNTYSVIKDLKDPRIKYFKNQENIGAVRNIVRVLERAKGKFSLLISDEDIICISTISTIKKIIDDTPNISAILGGVLDQENRPYIQYARNKYIEGKETMENIAFSNFYISGVIFNNDLIDFQDLNQQLLKPNNGFLHLYPHRYILTRLTLLGDIITIDNFICKQGEKGKNYIEKQNGKMFNHPLARVEQFKTDLTLSTMLNADLDIRINMLLKLYRMVRSTLLELKRNIDNKELMDYFNLSIEETNLLTSIEKCTEIAIQELDKYKIEENRYLKIKERLLELKDSAMLYFAN